MLSLALKSTALCMAKVRAQMIQLNKKCCDTSLIES